MQRGLLWRGAVVPGTDWILREPEAWWSPGERGTRPRTGAPSLLVGHWTAGRPHEGPGTAQRVVRAMRARRRDDGSPLDVGIGFVVGWDGLVYQTADLDTAAVHVGSADWNARSVGVECCWPGTITQARRLDVDLDIDMQGVVRRVAGAKVIAMRPSAELVAAWVRLAETLATVLGIPRRVPSRVARMERREARAWTGAAEHLHCPGTTKVDAAGLLIEALADAGWDTA
jgi:hypothetical protein